MSQATPWTLRTVAFNVQPITFVVGRIEESSNIT